MFVFELARNFHYLDQSCEIVNNLNGYKKVKAVKMKQMVITIHASYVIC